MLQLITLNLVTIVALLVTSKKHNKVVHKEVLMKRKKGPVLKNLKNNQNICQNTHL